MRLPASRSGQAVSMTIVGNLNIDLMMHGFRDLPVWGQERFGTGRLAVTAGQAGYMAMAAASLAARRDAVRVVGVVGDDADGAQIRADLDAAGVDCRSVRTVPGSTGLTVAVIREDGERAFVSDSGVSRALTADTIRDEWATIAESPVVAVVGVFNTPGLVLADVEALLRDARRGGGFTVFDPGWDAEGWPAATRSDVLAILSEVDLFLPNEDEARALTGCDDVEEALRVLDRSCSGLVVVKRGALGSIAFDDDRVIAVPATPVTDPNAVGAGDVFDAALVTALQSGLALEAAMTFAGGAAAFYVSRTSDRYPLPADLV